MNTRIAQFSYFMNNSLIFAPVKASRTVACFVLSSHSIYFLDRIENSLHEGRSNKNSENNLFFGERLGITDLKPPSIFGNTSSR